MILISACLANIPCRWDGKAKPNNRIIELVKSGQAILVCPEQLGGLTTPRDPAEIKDGKVITNKGKDVTIEFIKGAEVVLDIAHQYGCKKAILKAKSPSCGKNEIYDGTFSDNLVKGYGITTSLLLKNGIDVISENELPI